MQCKDGVGMGNGEWRETHCATSKTLSAGPASPNRRYMHPNDIPPAPFTSLLLQYIFISTLQKSIMMVLYRYQIQESYKANLIYSLYSRSVFPITHSSTADACIQRRVWMLMYFQHKITLAHLRIHILEYNIKIAHCQ